jgi:integrase
LGLRNNRDLKDGCIRDLFLKRFGKSIEEYESFKHATEGLRNSTSSSYRRMLPHFFLFIDQDPDSVIKQRKLDVLSEDDIEVERYERLTAAFAKSLVERGLIGSFVINHQSRVQGFFSNNGRRLGLMMRKLKIPKARRSLKYSPNNEVVRDLFAAADSARDKLIVALMYQNGPSPVDVSLLRCGDYPSEPWKYFERSRSKTGEIWHGVSTPDVCECLKAYLKVRGKYKSEDLLFVGREGALKGKGVSAIVRDLIVKAGFGEVKGFKPTSLRDAFEDALVDTETYHKTKEALVGHVSKIEQEYGGHNKMVSHLVDAMKKTYPLLCLMDVNRVSGDAAGFSPQGT